MMNMTKNKITLAEALELLAQGKLSEHHEIEYSDKDRIEATDAMKIGSLGLDVPEQRIYYDDGAIEEDEEFDGEWVEIASDTEDYKKYLTIELKVNEEVVEWLSSSKIDMDSLVSEDYRVL